MNRLSVFIFSSIVLFSWLNVFSAESIELYDKNRDQAFITKLIQELPQEFPEANLVSDFDSETLDIYWPDKDGNPSVHVAYKQKTFVYCIEHKPVGFVRLFDTLNLSPDIIKFRKELVAPVVETDRVSMIEQLAVLPEHRRKGIAEKLIKHVLHDRKKDGFGAVVLNTMSDNLASQKLYEKLKFIMVREEKESFWGCYKWYVFNTKDMSY